MLELNREYDYSGICEALGWEKVNGGGKRKRQLEAVKAAYEWHHPINPKTGKPNNRLYVFTKKLSEVTYEDGRKRNGRKPVIPDAQFEILLAHTVQQYGFETKPTSESKTKTLLFTSKIYAGFGFDVYGAIKRLREETGRAHGNTLVDMMLSGCVTNKAYTYSIARIARRTGEEKASLPKDVVQKEGGAPGGYKEASIELSMEFEEAFEVWKCVLTACGEMPANDIIIMSARELARKEVTERHEGIDVRHANVVTIPSRLLGMRIEPRELASAKASYFDAVMSAVRKRVKVMREKEFWGQTYVDDALKDGLLGYMEAFEKVAKDYRAI